jgi:DNA (cytosine-5)-methyltransferase 1
MLTYLAIADKFKPKWLVWENVPGVLSSNEGKDFGVFLGALGELGYGFAYRILDAQYFGVAQRRKRVFVVGHLGDWKPAAEVLFESESLRGNIKKGKIKKQNIATGFVPSVAIQGNLIGRDKGGPQGIGVSDSNTMYTLTKTDVHAVFCDTYNGTIQGDVAATMTADMAGPTHSGPKVMQNMAVRRLTEIECERLQGFPDNYTNIKENCPSGARYKALGNSMAVPVMRWIGNRIKQIEA